MRMKTYHYQSHSLEFIEIQDEKCDITEDYKP